MDWTLLGSWIGLLLGGGLIGAWLLHLREKQKNALGGYHALSEDAMALMRELKADNAELRVRVKALESEIDQLRHEWDTEREDWRQQCAAFSLERANWQRQVRLLTQDKERLEARAGSGKGG